jgi:hypothetical protein
MSGIFNGNSIYKSGGGGGGGGYHDGGALVDADFIKVENNSISTYDNMTRNEINFYFEPKDGEILNSVVELTTAVNSNVNVYVLKNGLYYILGNIGGNSVNAGDDYKVNIIGDSYTVEQVNNVSTDPKYILAPNGSIQQLFKLKNGKYISGYVGGYNNWVSRYQAQDYANSISSQGWRLMNGNDFSYLTNNYTANEIKNDLEFKYGGYSGGDYGYSYQWGDYYAYFLTSDTDNYFRSIQPAWGSTVSFRMALDQLP